MFDIDLKTVVADSVVYEPSREMMPVSEGPGLDYNADVKPERPVPEFGERLNRPSGNFVGTGPVEHSTVSHTSGPSGA